VTGFLILYFFLLIWPILFVAHALHSLYHFAVERFLNGDMRHREPAKTARHVTSSSPTHERAAVNDTGGLTAPPKRGLR
jgi:hypothetical protein